MLIDDVTGVSELQLLVKQLWGILDDIDVASELCDDDKQYRSIVEMLDKKRYNTGLSSNGFKLFFNELDAK